MQFIQRSSRHHNYLKKWIEVICIKSAEDFKYINIVAIEGNNRSTSALISN